MVYLAQPSEDRDNFSVSFLQTGDAQTACLIAGQVLPSLSKNKLVLSWFEGYVAFVSMYIIYTFMCAKRLLGGHTHSIQLTLSARIKPMTSSGIV